MNMKDIKANLTTEVRGPGPVVNKVSKVNAVNPRRPTRRDPARATGRSGMPA